MVERVYTPMLYWQQCELVAGISKADNTLIFKLLYLSSAKKVNILHTEWQRKFLSFVCHLVCFLLVILGEFSQMKYYFGQHMRNELGGFYGTTGEA